jgi:hypothetical protein
MQQVIKRSQRRRQSGPVDLLSHRHSSVLSPRPLLDAPIPNAQAQRYAAGHFNASPVGAAAVAECVDQKSGLNVLPIADEIAWRPAELEMCQA